MVNVTRNHFLLWFIFQEHNDIVYLETHTFWKLYMSYRIPYYVIYSWNLWIPHFIRWFILKYNHVSRRKQWESDVLTWKSFTKCKPLRMNDVLLTHYNCLFRNPYTSIPYSISFIIFICTQDFCEGTTKSHEKKLNQFICHLHLDLICKWHAGKKLLQKLRSLRTLIWLWALIAWLAPFRLTLLTGWRCRKKCFDFSSSTLIPYSEGSVSKRESWASTLCE